MNDETMTALLTDAGRALREQVMPALEAGGRYQAAMVARAIDLVARAIDRQQSPIANCAALEHDGDRSAASLYRAILDGEHDADRRVHLLLWQACVAEVAITQPSMLNRQERRLAGFEEDALTPGESRL